MSKGWTDERRKKQAEMIRKHKPWEKSTGPKSLAGKAASSRNALKHGLYSMEAETIKALLASNEEFMALYARLCGVGPHENLPKQSDKIFNKINRPPPASPQNGETK